MFGAASDVDVTERTIFNELADLLHRHLQTAGDILERQQSIIRSASTHTIGISNTVRGPGRDSAPGCIVLVRLLPPHALQSRIRPRHEGSVDQAQVASFADGDCCGGGHVISHAAFLWNVTFHNGSDAVQTNVGRNPFSGGTSNGITTKPTSANLGAKLLNVVPEILKCLPLPCCTDFSSRFVQE